MALVAAAAADIVGWYDHDEAGERTGKRNVFNAHLGCTVLADRDPRVATDDLHIEAGICDGHPKLIICIAMMNAAKLAIRLVLPDAANPDAIPTRLLSAIPMLKKRSGYFLPNHSVRVELLTSASTTTTLEYSVSQRFECAAKRVAGRFAQLPFRLYRRGRCGHVQLPLNTAKCED